MRIKRCRVNSLSLHRWGLKVIDHSDFSIVSYNVARKKHVSLLVLSNLTETISLHIGCVYFKRKKREACLVFYIPSENFKVSGNVRLEIWNWFFNWTLILGIKKLMDKKENLWNNCQDVHYFHKCPWSIVEREEKRKLTI